MIIIMALLTHINVTFAQWYKMTLIINYMSYYSALNYSFIGGQIVE